MTAAEISQACQAWKDGHPLEAAVIQQTYLGKVRQSAKHAKTYLVAAITERLHCTPQDAAQAVRA